MVIYILYIYIYFVCSTQTHHFQAGEDGENLSQFFITLDRCEDLDSKYTIFGKLGSDTIFNALQMATLETDENDRPMEPPKILRAKVGSFILFFLHPPSLIEILETLVSSTGHFQPFPGHCSENHPKRNFVSNQENKKSKRNQVSQTFGKKNRLLLLLKRTLFLSSNQGSQSFVFWRRSGIRNRLLRG